MTTPPTVPNAVHEAAKTQFRLAITGYLFEPELCGFCLTGRVFLDQKERFRPGRLIRTSAVEEFVEQCGYTLAATWSGSVYVLVAEDGPWVFAFPEGRWNGASTDC
ncbi:MULTISPECIES: hypothetical protein [Pseudomonas]|uniref:Uncharacterized protein n=1 Tax=Pseudomonas savastanoi pv. savastanoi NCPPB 3335 TaxID=693985 RepID=A0ABC8BH76_PSESS|nr:MULTISPECIES: hypothetical protein [Pseudomonas]ARD13740.1 hypothetical protein PSA3335_23450 [Pseudomonas savastanoi pv. savastanoi NCPPB 3335]KAA3538441.1 hypothetical protein DXU85_21230 [Pseudomonas savastanoi]KWS75377.1 hypothetical protein AL053_19305 [Pseudomonas savastanoi pv. fraxini]MBA4706435.1 hypothetical protein [Pseudomonas savastanoi pv. savastanoi]PAB24742.1 hypothetical protein CCZ00_27140 [Pseudomonas savastanoi pv. fraxini]